MNIILALDTSGISSSVAVLHGGSTLVEITRMNPRKQHCEGFMPMLDRCLDIAGLSPQDLDAIACASGPGSFTGIRIGAAAAKGLAHAVGVGIIAVPTLDALAYNVFNISEVVVPIMDARRGQVYTALYSWEDSRLTRLSEYECAMLDDVLNLLEERGQQAVFTGDATEPFRDVIISRGHRVSPENTRYVWASSVGLMASDMMSTGYIPLDYGEFSPFYLRKPQAERELEHAKFINRYSETHSKG